MKLHKLTIDGFRGAPKELIIPLGDKSHFFYAENGRGKSTIADALEFLTTGALVAFRREECGIDAAVNVNGSGSASVAAEIFDPAGTATRTLGNDDPSAIELSGDLTDLPPIPILRQSTINAFMQQTSGEKRKALLELLDLDALNVFRKTLRTAVGNAKDRRTTAVSALKDEEEALDGLLGGKELLVHANELAGIAKIGQAVGSAEDLKKLELKLSPKEPNRQEAVTELARAHAALDPDPMTEWNGAVADEEARRAEALGALLAQGQKVLDGDWTEDSCPLCELPNDMSKLTERLSARAESFALSRERIGELRQKLAQRIAASGTIAQAIGALVKVAPEEGWPEQDKMIAAQVSLGTYLTALQHASKELEPCPAHPDLGIDFIALLPDLQKAAEPKESPQLAAVQRLHELRGQWQRVGTKQAKVEATKSTESALKALLETCDGSIKAAVEEALGTIQDLVGDYFALLMADPVYTNVKLIYSARRSGQVEFSLDFGDHTIQPPQRIMSESQLNALGLALLLARVKNEDGEWRTLVLDDVVNSFDSPHRAGLIRLLRKEFSDWQVLVLTHDSVFRDIGLREAGAGWQFHEFIFWTAAGGPIIGEGDPLNRLEEGLNKGETPAALGGYARKALELTLSRILAKLDYRITYDPASRYSPYDFLRALASGLKDEGSSIAEAEILHRVDTGNYMATSTVHNRPDQPEATSEDLRHLVDDLKALKAAFRCDDCDKPVWFAETNNGHQCKCGVLTA